MALQFPDIDPVALSLGPLDIRWYSLAYLAGFLIGWRYALYLVSLRNGDAERGIRPDKSDIEEFIPWAVLGVIVGGRLGYTLFYNFSMYSQSPLDVFKVWEGGMSFHGGVLGVVFSVVIYSLLRKINVLRLADVVCASAPIGLFFGRIANFVNGELYGRASDAMWAVEFPRGGFVPRHPSQLYEAMLEGLVLFLLLMVLYKRPEVRERPGIVAGVFFIFYACARMFIEQFREPDAQVGFLFESVTMGQMLSLPMLLLGCLVVFYSLRKGADISDGKAG